MTTPICLRPRDAVGAAAAVFSLAACSMLVLGLGVLLSSSHLGPSPLRWFGLAVVIAAVPAARSLRFVPDPAHWAWQLVPVTWVMSLAVAGLVLRNPDLHIELLLLFPAMYACRQLDRSAALTVNGCCVIMVPILALAGSNPRPALFEALVFAPVLLVVTVRLTVTGQRFDHLIAEMQSRATTDALTKLGTRHTLERALDRLADSTPTDGNALLVIDIDNFKGINDRHGHPAGDAVLVQLAAVILGNCRGSDLPCRIGGDELAVLYRHISCPAAQRRADAIRTDVEQRIFVLPDATPIRLTVSLGVAHCATGQTRFADLYDHGDRALYRAKRSGRNATALYDAA